MTLWANPKTIKSITEKNRSNIKALNPFNFTHSTVFPIKLKGIPLILGNEIAFNHAHFSVNEGFNSIGSNSLIHYFTSKNELMEKKAKLSSYNALLFPQNKSIEVNSPSPRGASCLSSDKIGVGRRNRIAGKHSKKCFVGSLDDLQRMNGNPFHRRFN